MWGFPDPKGDIERRNCKYKNFHLSNSLGIYDSQKWIFEDFLKWENLFPEDLVAKHDLKKY